MTSAKQRRSSKPSKGVWREAELEDPRGNNNKLATYQACFATPFTCNARQTYLMEPLCMTSVLAIKLKMKLMFVLPVLMNKFVLALRVSRAF
eukprot:1153109-Pelagomonas_calceolata.AAC.14